MSQAVFDGYSWLQERVRAEGFPARGNYTNKLSEEITLCFSDETIVLPVGTSLVVYRRRGSSRVVSTYATVFIPKAAGRQERQISVRSDGSLKESQLAHQVKCHRFVGSGLSYIRATS